MAIISRQTDMIVAVATTLAAATAALILRFVARRMTRVPLWWDDFMCIGAFVFGVGWNALLITWVPYGFGLHINDTKFTEKESLETSLVFCYLAELLYAFSLAFSKYAILGFYWRMFRTSNIKIPIITLVVATSIWLILRTFLAIFHCVPVQAFWDHSISDATCLIDDSKFFFGTVLTHLFLDLAILSLPVLQVRKLQLRTAQKVGVIAMFMFGILVCMASIVVLVYSVSYDTKSPDISWNVAPIMTWATVEVNLATISACLPMLRPIFMKAFKRLFPQASRDTSDKNYQPGRPGQYMMSRSKAKFGTGIYSESTQELAAADDDISGHADGENAAYATNGPKVVITSNSRSVELDRKSESSTATTEGILVRSETRVEVTHAR